MTAIVAMVGDAHTSLNWTSGLQPFRRYPLTLRVFQDQAYVTAVGALLRESNRGRQSYVRALSIPSLTAPFLTRVPTPLARTRPASQFYWYEYLESAQTVYFQYNRCVEMPTLPFASFLPQLLALIDSRPVAKLVVDLRQNTGGNSAILVPFINAVRARPALNRRGVLLVVIDNGTFSSGMLNAVNFQTQTQATFVCEPTGGKPNSYGEVQSFTLPNSRISVSYSTRLFQTVPGDPPSVLPDLPVEMSVNDLLAGRDPVLEAILALP